MEGCWSLLRSWLRPHRGISEDKLPLYLGFFQRADVANPAQGLDRRLGYMTDPSLLWKPIRAP